MFVQFWLWLFFQGGLNFLDIAADASDDDVSDGVDGAYEDDQYSGDEAPLDPNGDPWPSPNTARLNAQEAIDKVWDRALVHKCFKCVVFDLMR